MGFHQFLLTCFLFAWFLFIRSECFSFSKHSLSLCFQIILFIQFSVLQFLMLHVSVKDLNISFFTPIENMNSNERCLVMSSMEKGVSFSSTDLIRTL